jgi:alcohol dehydrogenase class IV
MTQALCFGVGAVSRLSRILDRLRASRVFLVTGGESYAASGAADAIDGQLRQRTVSRFSGFAENPQVSEVEVGIRAITAAPFDVVVAVGGGSVMDMGKLVNALARQGEAPADFVQAGRTPFEHVKYSLSSPGMLPDAAIVDPTLTYSLPRSVTAASGLDALAQAIESYWCIHSTEQSKSWARRAIRLVLDHLTTAVNSPTAAARRAMSKAAHFAGRAINVTRTTGAHALSYPLTSYFGIPHGHAVALTLGEFFVWNSGVADADVTDARGARYVRAAMRELAEIMGCTDAAACRTCIRELMRVIGLETNLGALGISQPQALDVVVRNVNVERLVNNPRALTGDQLERLVAAIC